MNTPIFVSDIDPVAGFGDLPVPETAFAPVATERNALPRPIPSIGDTGRISFGAACRLPTTK